MFFVIGIFESAACCVLVLIWLMWPEDREWMLREIGTVPCPFGL